MRADLVRFSRVQTNFKFVYYVDRKQSAYDKEIVTVVRQKDDGLELVVCRYLLEI